MAKEAMKESELERRERNRPRTYDITNTEELERLLHETIGYAQVSLHNRDGTDWEGRQYAVDALRRAFKAGYRLVRVTP